MSSRPSAAASSRPRETATVKPDPTPKATHTVRPTVTPSVTLTKTPRPTITRRATATPKPTTTRRPSATATSSQPAQASSTSAEADQTPEPSGSPTAEPQLPTIDYFQASRKSVTQGDRIKLSWDLHDAQEAYLIYDEAEHGVVAPASQVFTPTQTTQYLLAARNADGQVSSGITVTVKPAPPPPTPDGILRDVQVPILMYHYVSVPPADANVYRQDLSVSPGQFEEQLAWLRSEGYQTITLTQLLYHIHMGQDLPEKPVVLTFDDGYRDAYTQAFPLLKKYGFTGTFFLVTFPIDQNHEDYLSWDMVEEMDQAGMDMEIHGYRHYDLKGRDVDFLVYEIAGPQESLQDHTGKTPRLFCYPAGSYDYQTISVLQSAGFWAAVTTAQGTNHASDDLFELNRMRVRGGHSLEEFIEVVTADW